MSELAGGALETKAIQTLVFRARGKSVILDEDLARLFDTSTRALNQQIKRNIERFEERFVFQLTQSEYDALKSQLVISKTGRGGRRTLPWAFTEHGIPMAASVLTTPRAVEAMKLIIDVFVATRSQVLSGASRHDLLPDRNIRESGRAKIQAKLVEMANLIFDFEVNKRDGTSVRNEIEILTTSVLDNVKAQLQSKVIENQSVLAEVHKTLAEAEKIRAEARKTTAEADKISIDNLRGRLELLQTLESKLNADNVAPMLETMSTMAAERPMIDVTPAM
jgi:hypothetical protein